MNIVPLTSTMYQYVVAVVLSAITLTSSDYIMVNADWGFK